MSQTVVDSLHNLLWNCLKTRKETVIQIEEKLKEEDVSYDDIMGFSDKDLRNTLNECNIKALYIGRIIKYVKGMEASAMCQESKKIKLLKIYVSSKEAEAFDTLSKKHKLISDAVNDVEQYINDLESNQQNTLKSVNDVFSKIYHHLEQKKSVLQQQIHKIAKDKSDELIQQLHHLITYRNELQSAKKQYDKTLGNLSLSAHDREETNLNNIHKAMESEYRYDAIHPVVSNEIVFRDQILSNDIQQLGDIIGAITNNQNTQNNMDNINVSENHSNIKIDLTADIQITDEDQLNEIQQTNADSVKSNHEASSNDVSIGIESKPEAEQNVNESINDHNSKQNDDGLEICDVTVSTVDDSTNSNMDQHQPIRERESTSNNAPIQIDSVSSHSLTEAKNKQQNNHQNKNSNGNKKQKNKNQRNKKKGKNKNRNKKKHPYELRDRKPINYKYVAIDYNGYDTDEELNKLYILKQQYPGFETAIVPLEIDPQWNYDELIANKPLVLGTKYRWNFCSSYFSNDASFPLPSVSFPLPSFQHIYDASFSLPSPKQYIKYEAMLKECIKRVTKYHFKTMDVELKKQFEAFPEQYRIQFSDSILMFDGIDSVLKGRSVRVGFFKTNKDCNDKKTNNAAMLIAYADNKQFVAEFQQFFCIKDGGFTYESRKWALADDPAFTNITGTIGNTDKWMDIALIVGVSIVNRLLNSIYKQELFDVTDLLPPFDDLQSLLKNDSLWWIELEKRIVPSDYSSDVSSYQGSLQDFIVSDVSSDQGSSKINIKEALSADHGERRPLSGMLHEYLLLLKEYKEEDDESYTLGENEKEKEKNAEEYEAFIDETIGEDLKGFLRENMDDNKMNVEDKTSNLKEENDTKNRKRKRDITEIEKEGGSKVEDKEESAPPTKKQKVSATLLKQFMVYKQNHQIAK